MYKVVFKRKIVKSVTKMPLREQKLFANLVQDLSENGPIQKNWPNFSRLAGENFHCHLSYHWVACWTVFEDVVQIEVYYVGSRESAPY